jgi:diketogulonate reductase-like aldo/keto reductase
MTTPAIPDLSAPLPSGASMPLLGFGTWQITGPAATTATAAALSAGYRHVDTATVYTNEGEVGAALDGADVFVTTKLPGDGRGPARETLQRSLELLKRDSVDLWLIHWPEDSANVDMWRDLIDARDAGLTKDIGVSNYSLEQMDELHAATGAMPAVNQIEWSPLLFDRAVLDGHRERGVVLEGYSALRGGTLEHPVITSIADRLGRTPAQVIIRWHLQHGVVVIPKSEHPERIVSNADVGGFELTDDDMTALDGLS